MRKRVVTFAVMATVGLGSVYSGGSVKTEAASISSLKDQKQQIENKQSTVDSNINKAQSKVSDLQNQQADVQSDMKRIDTALSETTKKITEENAKVTETKASISKLQADIKVIQARIAKRNELLKDRFRNYQETGGVVDYLDVLLGSTSFSDFIDRANAVATIMQADQAIIQQHEKDKQMLQDKEDQVQKDLTSLNKMVANLEKLNQQLNSQKAEKNKLLASLKEQEGEAHNDVMNLQEQKELLAAQDAAIQKAIKLEQERQAEAARAAKAAKASQSNSSSSSSSSAPAPSVSSGYWTQPAQGYISSGYGGRPRDFHYGVDIANHGANVPIVAAADGVISRSYLSSSYGNCIFLTSSINGQIYTTVYAHMAKRLVGNGAVVKKGQQIGIMGSTGESTGQHLHFELHKGPWTYDKHNAINPAGIVPLP